MAGSTISGTITQTVKLGRGGFHSPLTITATGDIAPIAAGTDGILVPSALHGGQIINRGRISGAYGGRYTGPGGIGVDAAASVSLTNTGTITGGDGGYSQQDGYLGGIGVDLRAGGNLANRGQITGGTGGYGFSRSGNGGDAVRISGGVLSNTGIITGGTGHDGGIGQGGTGGIGVLLTRGSAAANGGTILGGQGIYGYHGDGGGGIGVQIDASSLVNTGVIAGGDPGGGYGAFLPGGIGVALTAGALLTNMGSVFGGGGGYGHFNGSDGGVGVSVLDATVTNFAAITGGAGGPGGEGYGGTGGVGVSVQNGSLFNSGTITGGRGGSSAIGRSYGGTGVALDGGTLVTSGSISGGVGYNYMGGGETIGYSVAFGSMAGTIVLEPGALFTGAVSGFTTGDVLDSTRKVTALTFISGTLTLQHSHSVSETLALTGIYDQTHFQLKSDGHGGTDITYVSGSSQQTMPDFASSVLDTILPRNFAMADHGAAFSGQFGHGDAGALTAFLGAHVHTTL